MSASITPSRSSASARSGGLFRAAGVTVAARIAGLGLSFLSGLLVARFLGPAGKGTVSYLSAMTTLAARCMSFGLEGAFTRVHLVQGVDRSVAIGTLVRMVGALGLFAVAVGQVALFVSPGLAAGIPTELVRASLVAIPAAMFVYVFSYVLFGIRHEGTFALFDVGYRSATLIGQGAALYFLGRMLAPVVWVQLASTLAFAACALVILWRSAERQFPWSMAVGLQMLRFGASFFAYGTLRYALTYGGVAFSAWYLSVADAGVFSIALMLAEVISLMSGSVNLAFYPAVATSDRAAAYTWTTAWRVTATSGLVGLGMASLAGPLIGLLYGSSFAPAVPAFLWMLPGAVLMAGEQTLSSYFATRNELGPASVALAAGLVLQWFLAKALAPELGVTGLGLAATAGQAAAALGVFMVFARASQSSNGRDTIVQS